MNNGQPTSEETPKNIKDMKDDLNQRLSRIMDDIESARMDLVSDPFIIKSYGEKVHIWFMNLSRKMAQEDIKKQNDFNKKLGLLNPIGSRNYNHLGTPCKPYDIINQSQFDKYKELLEEREMHLYSLIDRLETKRKVI